MSDSPAPAYTELDQELDDVLSLLTPASASASTTATPTPAPTSTPTSTPPPTPASATLTSTHTHASAPTPPTPTLPPPNPGNSGPEELGGVRPATPEDVAEEDALAAGPDGFPGPGLKRGKRIADRVFMTRGEILQLFAVPFENLEAQYRRLSHEARDQQVMLLQVLEMLRAQVSITNGRIVDMDSRVAT